MRINPTTSLKWSGIICAALWSGWMMWWIGSFDLATTIIFSIGGAVFGLCWYVAMRFIVQGLRLLPGDGRTDVTVRSRGKLYVWLVWAGLMALTGIATACLLDLVSPLIPSGDWHWLIRSLFIIMVWPGLMWSLRPLMKHHLPA